MFLRRYRRNKDGKQHTYFALVESVRTATGPRQHVVAYLGELNHDQERRWQRTVTCYNRQGDVQQLRLFPEDEDIALPDDPDIVRIRLQSVGWTNARSFGDVWLAHWLWKLLKLDEIVARHVPQGKQTVRPADVVAIEVINRLCAPCSEFALAEHWYASTGLQDLLGVATEEVTKDRLYRTLDGLLKAQRAIEDDVKEQFGALFQLDYDLLLYDLTSTYFEGLAEENDLAKRGYSRDHRRDCKQVVLALVVTREGFPLAHFTLAGNTQDVNTVETIVTAVEERFGKSQRVWVMDRGMISRANVDFLSAASRRYIIGLNRSALADFDEELNNGAWEKIADKEVQVQLVERDGLHYLLARSPARQAKERAIRQRQLLALQRGLQRLQAGRLKNRDKILEKVGRLKAENPKAAALITITVGKPQKQKTQPTTQDKLTWKWRGDKMKRVLARDGAYVLQSNQQGWSATMFWESYMQLTVVERCFRVFKSELLLRPVWHQYSGRTQAHVFVCVLAYALWKTLDHLAKRAGLETLIRKPDLRRRNASPQARPMTPEVILRELAQIKIGDILLETTDGRQLALRRVARPTAEQARILAALGLTIPERLGPDRFCSEDPTL